MFSDTELETEKFTASVKAQQPNLSHPKHPLFYHNPKEFKSTNQQIKSIAKTSLFRDLGISFFALQMPIKHLAPCSRFKFKIVVYIAYVILQRYYINLQLDYEISFEDHFTSILPVHLFKYVFHSTQILRCSFPCAYATCFPTILTS